MNVRDALTQRLRDRMMRMRSTLDRFNDSNAENEKVGPKWNVRDLVGHFVFWVEKAPTQLQEMEKRSTPGVDGALPDQPKHEIDKVNEEVFRKYRRMSFVMLTPQLRTAEDRLLEALGRVDSKLLIGDTPVRLYVDVHIEHYDHHWPGLKAAAERLG